jgi:hypothetical protein
MSYRIGALASLASRGCVSGRDRIITKSKIISTDTAQCPPFGCCSIRSCRSVSAASSSSSSQHNRNGSDGGGGSSSSSSDSTPGDGFKQQRKRIRRTRSGLKENIPDFKDFQIQQQVRGLYRRFTRLASSTQQREVQDQIRREFRLPRTDRFHIQRAVSEGHRRYKELAAMLLSSVPGVRTKEQNEALDGLAESPQQEQQLDSTSATSCNREDWPWNKPSNSKPSRPLAFPPKSNL